MRREYCDLILYNGKIATVDQDFSIAEAVAIGGGKFLEVGRNDKVRALADPETKEVDLKGKTVVPGFIDTHPHVIHAAMGRTTSVPLMGLSSIEAIKKAIAERVEKTAPGKWIITSPVGNPPYYFNPPDILKGKRWPTRWDLDEVSPNNPVYIQAPPMRVPNTSILNSYGLKLMEITKDTLAEQQGVEIVKDPETGEPNGQLHGMQSIYNFSPVFNKLMSLLPPPMLEDMLNGLRATIKDYNAAGVTTIYEGHYVFSDFLLLCKELWSRKELTMRIYFAYEVDLTKSMDEIQSWMKDMAHATGSGFGDDWLKIGGITVSVDGPIIHGLALMNKPYLDPYGKPTTGMQFVSTDNFKQIALTAARHNLRLNSCFGGDKAADITLEVLEQVDREISIKDRRWVIQHIQFPSQENIDKCKELQLAITTCSNFEWGKGTEVYVGRLGKEMAARAIPLRRWLDAGIPISQSTDVGPYQPMFTLWQSLKRIHGVTGESFAGPDQKITREEAIRMYTINGAGVLFWDDKLGSIEAGKLADLVVLDNDILTCPLDEIKDTKVLMTMVGGQVVYEGW
ncbi:MAG: amidohydrolase [Dehalococcoidia bacterium]|nr:amidohydrolase [Dehalococcoidia bacterium]